MIESWNGTSWSAVNPNPTRPGPELGGVSCVSLTACTAVGSYVRDSRGETLIDSWNGTKWSAEPSPNSGATSGLDSVSCASAAACTAAGSYSTSNPPQQPETLIESGSATG
jgi:hypothetical protein